MENYIKCPICGKEVRRLKYHFYRSKVHEGFDYKSYLLNHPEVVTLSESEKEKYSAQNKKTASSEKSRQMAIKFWSDENRRNKRVQEIRDQHETKEFKDLHRRVAREFMLNRMSDPEFYEKAMNNIRSKGKRVYFTKKNGEVLKLRSQLEYYIAEYLDSINIDFQYEKSSIPYEINEEIHSYHIDFTIPSLSMAIEGKPESLWDREDTVLKLNAAKKFYSYVLLVGYDLSNLKKTIESVTTIESITQEKDLSE